MKSKQQITFEFSQEAEKEQKDQSGNVITSKKEKTKTTRGRKSIKEMSEELDNVEIPEDEVLFQKQYYSIGEVAEMFNVNTSLLRYWEGEFGMQLRKNRKGDRFFTPGDVKTLQLIHDLVRRRKFTIEGAKDYLKKNTRADDKYVMIQSLQRLKTFLLELKAHL
ncbi:MAG TPA: MerR family transcriptional regulator [Chitinophagaceae bacterium]|nr:MerR family transcriptional regulator [Chitinophagaceae bacterium]